MLNAIVCILDGRIIIVNDVKFTLKNITFAE